MPPTDDRTGGSFRGLALQLRGRTGLTQREFATQVGVNVSSLQAWEAGESYPGVANLQALIGAGLRSGGFTAGLELEEAQALWAAALRDAPRLRAPFDGAWFERLIARRQGPVLGDADAVIPPPPATTSRARRESWGDAPDLAGFLNRTSERTLLRQWVLDEGSRLVALLGLGGIGKSLLATRLARDLAPSFERVYWRSLRDAPTPGEWLAEVLGFLVPNESSPAQGEAAQARRLLDLLSDARCLLVLDNFETVLQPGGPVGGYRAGYERYGTLLRQVGEALHRSCLVVTSREEPSELRPLLGERGPVRALELSGFGADDGRALLDDKELDGDEAAWRALVDRYGGNGLALKVVGETTRELFGGSIADYLEYAATSSGMVVRGVRQLLRAQVQRLSGLEVDLLRRLTVEREPVGLADLAADLGPRIGRAAVLEAVEGLRRRSLLEWAGQGRLFGLQSVVMEYVTDQLIDDVAQELALDGPDLLLRQPLLKASAKDYVRRSQERLILGPLVERLVETRGSARAAEQRLLGMLDAQRGRPVEVQGYGPGNLVNLLRLLRGDLRGADLSGLAIRQAYLQDVVAQGASLAGSHLSETVLGEAFNYVTALMVSADGAYLVAGTVSGEVCWLRVADRALLATLPGHAGAVWAVALSADGRLVASGSDDGTIRLWDAVGMRGLATLRGHTGGVLSVALSEDGRLLASGSFDGTVRLWEAGSGQQLGILPGHIGAVRGALSGDGHLVASGDADGIVRLWQVEDGRLLAALQGHIGAIWAMALSKDGRMAASGGMDGTVRLWDTVGRRGLATLHGHNGGVMSVALSADGQLVASGSYDGTIRLWEAVGGRPLATLHGHISGMRVALSGDGHLVASDGLDGTVRLWETKSGRVLVLLHGLSDGLRGVALSGDGRLLASGGLDGVARLWDAGSGQLLDTLRGHAGAIWGVALSGDGRRVASGDLHGTVRVWEAESSQPLATLRGHAGGVWGVALSVDGRLAASAGFDWTVRLWEVGSGHALRILRGHTGVVRAVALSGDGGLVASGSVDETVRLWQTENGQPLATLRGHTGEVYAVATNGNGRLVASGGFDGTVRLWDTATGNLLATLRGHTGGVRGVALSADGRLAASGGFDGTVRLWEAATSEPLATLHGHTGGVWGVALSGDGRLVSSGGDDGTVRIWDTRGGTLRRMLRGERRYEALDITGLTGITDAQRGTLFALGAIERGGGTVPST